MSAWPSPSVPSVLRGADRIVHAGLYTVLGATLGYGRHHARAPSHWVLIALGALYGVTDEWHQAYVPGRSPDVVDWLADVTGVLFGYGLVLVALGWLANRTAGRRDDPMTDVPD